MYEILDAQIEKIVQAAGPCPVVLLGGLGAHVNGSLNSVLPTILHKLESHFMGLSLPADRLDRERLFFAQYNAPLAGGIRLNLVGREPNGQVSEQDYDKVCDFLSQAILDIKNLDNGKKVARHCIKTRDEYHGPAVAQMPDILCVWSEDALGSAIGSDEIGECILTPDTKRGVLDYRTGDHNNLGWLAYNSAAAEFFPEHGSIKPEGVAEYLSDIMSHSMKVQNG